MGLYPTGRPCTASGRSFNVLVDMMTVHPAAVKMLQRICFRTGSILADCIASMMLDLLLLDLLLMVCLAMTRQPLMMMAACMPCRNSMHFLAPTFIQGLSVGSMPWQPQGLKRAGITQ